MLQLSLGSAPDGLGRGARSTVERQYATTLLDVKFAGSCWRDVVFFEFTDVGGLTIARANCMYVRGYDKIVFFLLMTCSAVTLFAEEFHDPYNIVRRHRALVDGPPETEERPEAITVTRAPESIWLKGPNCQSLEKELLVLRAWRQQLGERIANKAECEVDPKEGARINITKTLPLFAATSLGLEFPIYGPNCFNNVLLGAGLTEGFRESEEDELSAFLQSPYCEEIRDRSRLKTGDIFVTGTRDFNLIHSFTYLSEALAFEKQGLASTEVARFRSPDGILAKHRIKPECISPASLKIQHECLTWAKVFRCDSERYRKDSSQSGAPQSEIQAWLGKMGLRTLKEPESAETLQRSDALLAGLKANLEGVKGPLVSIQRGQLKSLLTQNENETEVRRRQEKVHELKQMKPADFFRAFDSQFEGKMEVQLSRWEEALASQLLANPNVWISQSLEQIGPTLGSKSRLISNALFVALNAAPERLTPRLKSMTPDEEDKIQRLAVRNKVKSVLGR